MEHRIRIAVLLVNNDSILLVKHVHPKSKYEWWVPPGGGIEKVDDSIFDAAIREVWEETGLNVKTKEEIKYIREFFDEENNILNLELFIEGVILSGDLTINNVYGNGIDEYFIKSVEWISKDKLDELIVFPEIIKEDSFWKSKIEGNTIYLGRQKG